MRRRYRTATQLAIARGEPIPNMQDDYWGLGRLSGWTPEGFDRFGGVDALGRAGEGRMWEKIPEMYEAEVEEESLNRSWRDSQVGLD